MRVSVTAGESPGHAGTAQKGRILMKVKKRLKPELQASVKHWEYLWCHCIVQIGGLGVSFTYECSACDNRNLRFIHTLRKTGSTDLIQVGIECARTLVCPDDYEIPRLAENELKRKEKWRRHYKRPGRCVVTVDDLIDGGKL